MPSSPNRVIVKLSGESLSEPGQFGICPDELAFIAGEFVLAHSTGVQLAIVVGGGNIIRGTPGCHGSYPSEHR